MSLGEAPKHDDLFRSSTSYCDGRLSETSIYRLLHALERGCIPKTHSRST